MSQFTGLSAFPITPADPQGRVDTDAVSRLVLRAQVAGVHSVGLLGSTGTYAYLERAERQRAVAAAAEALGKDTPLIVGAGALRTDAAVTLAKDAAAAGATALLLAPVSYTPLTQDEAFTHFETVARATDLPICIYNNPGTTHFSFGLPLLVRLADLPTVKAVKMPLPAAGTLPDDLAQLRGALPANFQIGYSGDWGCAAALLAGADTWYSVLGGTLPDIAMRLTAAARRGDIAAAKETDTALAQLWALFQTYGSLRVVYAIANELGLTNAALPLPLLPLPSAVRTQVCATLDALGVRP
jgi:4-hydroxy-tetrahydrodipicolinate synthase